MQSAEKYIKSDSNNTKLSPECVYDRTKNIDLARQRTKALDTTRNELEVNRPVENLATKSEENDPRGLRSSFLHEKR